VTATARLGIVGCGRLAEAGYLPALAAVPRARVVAVADPDAARRAHVAGRAGHGVATFASAPELLGGAEVDGLLVASPAGAHVADARAAVAAGVAVLVEKPPAPDAAGAAAIAALDPQPWVGLNRRFDPGAVAVRGAIAGDRPIELELEIRYRRRSWGAHTVHDDALADLGPHLVDWARWLSGSEVVEVAAAALSAERAEVDLVLGRGRARLRAATDQSHVERIEARDGAGRRIASHHLGGPVAAVRGRLLPARRPSPLIASLSAQLDAFVDAFGGTPHPSLGTAADGVAVMTVIDAARASAAAGRAVPISLSV
jgi:predicted dehydrogenase